MSFEIYQIVFFSLMICQLYKPLEILHTVRTINDVANCQHWTLHVKQILDGLV